MFPRRKKNHMKSRQIDQRSTKQVRIDIGYRDLLKLKAAKSGMTIKELLEGYIAEGLKEETSAKY